MWRKAAEQMFFSLGVSWGGLMMFGSYNKFHNKINIGILNTQRVEEPVSLEMRSSSGGATSNPPFPKMP